ncbi:hypothetical protein MHIMP23_05120 [Methylobacterium hispanicum]
MSPGPSRTTGRNYPPTPSRFTLCRPGTISRQQLLPDPGAETPGTRARVAFELDPGSERASELRLQLRRGDRPVSETWLYRWTP